MRAFVRWFGALFAASLLCFVSRTLLAATSRSSRPRRPPRRTRPFRPPAIRSTARRLTTDHDTPPTSMPGMGKVHFPVTSKKPEVQAFIDQGVGQLHSFYYFEVRAIVPPGRPDRPRLRHGLLGHGDVEHQQRQACAGVSQGSPQAGRRRSPRHESLYLEALESFFKEGANAKTKRQNWLQGLETIVQEFPGDIDARAWLAMVTWQNSMDGIGSRQAVDTLLDTVLQVEPMHPGAHHYRIHLWDGVKPVRAEKSAALYAKTAPGSRTPGTCRATPTPG